jgi:hypothetical protein
MYAFLLMANAGIAAENFVELKYCTETIRPFSIGSMADVEAVIAIPREIARKYAGQHLTQIKIGSGSHAATNTQVLIRTGLEGEPVYVQPAAFTPAVWNVITLNEPYEIKGDEELYFGYSLTTDTYGRDFAIGIDDSPVADPNGDWIRCKLSGSEMSDWMHTGEQGFSNLCIIGVVEGDKPQRDVDLYALSAPSRAIPVQESFSINGTLKNRAMEPVTDLEISYKAGENEKVIRSFTELNIPSNGTFDFTISGIDFPKEADKSYSVEIAVEKVNGAEDEYPEDNTRSAAVRTWNAPDSPTMVSTQALKKNVILEEFTGVNCTYCPDGHRLANEVANAHPGRVSVINIHQGSFANVKPNYKTEWGDAIANQTGIDLGYPSGTINRHVFSGSYTSLGRGNFAPRTKTILAQDSYVNVALKATANEDTRELVVDVELYYTGNGAPVNRLNIALVQDSILGPQIGAIEYYPEMMVGDLYQHNHMLRDLLTKQWGDSIRQTTAGTFVAGRYFYAVPEKIGDAPVNLKKVEVIAFVAEGTQEIISGTSSKFSGMNYTDLPVVQPLDGCVSISDGLLIIHSAVPVHRAILYNLSGQKVLSAAPAEAMIPVKHLPSGVYLVKLQMHEGEKVVKVIKK